MEITRDLIEKKLSQLLVDDEAGWEAAANAIEAKIYNSEGIEIASYKSPAGFSSALMDRLAYQDNLQGRFAHGVQSLNDFEVAEELVWVLVPSGFIFGE
jgi:Ribonuclease G/E